MAHSPKQVSRIANALASEVRVQILLRLRKRGELTCREATEGMGRRQPTMSHHLTILRREGLVLTRKDTRKNRAVMVFINPERRAIIEALAA